LERLAPTKQFFAGASENPKARSTLAYYDEVVRHTNNAIAAYREAIRLNPKEAAYWANVGEAYRISLRPEEAIQAYLASLRLDPELVSSWEFLGALYGFQGKRDEVLLVYARLRELDPARADDFFKVWVLHPIEPPRR